MKPLVARLDKELKKNDGKISFKFIENEVEEFSTVKHFHLTSNTRVCVIRLESGHEVIGIAQVLDAKNDDEEIGQGVAFKNAREELWSVFGNIAKVLQA